MAKFYGDIGYNLGTVEKPVGSGVWIDDIIELPYYGDVIRNTRQTPEREYLNNDLTVSNTVSVVADAYANNHFFAIRYIKWAGALWTVTDVEVQSPRLLLRLGGVYNGQTPDGTA